MRLLNTDSIIVDTEDDLCKLVKRYNRIGAAPISFVNTIFDKEENHIAKKISYNEKREYKNLEREITKLENEKSKIEELYREVVEDQ